MALRKKCGEAATRIEELHTAADVAADDAAAAQESAASAANDAADALNEACNEVARNPQL
jgi:uncharacterized membrane protein